MKRLIAGFLLSAGMVGAVGWWAVSVHEPERGLDLDRPRRGARARRPEPVIVDVPRGEVDAALGALAEEVGAGWIACELGMPPGSELLAEGLDRLDVQGSVLRALVRAPEGSVAIAPLPDDGPVPDPAAVLTWTGATPGARGTCAVGQARFADLRLLLASSEGQPLGRSDVEAVGACWGLDEPTWDGAGGLRMRAIRGVVCRPWLRRGVDAESGVATRWEDHLPSVRVEHNGELALTLDASTRGAPELVGALASAEAIDRAMQRPGLSADALGVLARWREDAPVVDAVDGMLPSEALDPDGAPE